VSIDKKVEYRDKKKTFVVETSSDKSKTSASGIVKSEIMETPKKDEPGEGKEGVQTREKGGGVFTMPPKRIKRNQAGADRSKTGQSLEENVGKNVGRRGNTCRRE